MDIADPEPISPVSSFYLQEELSESKPSRCNTAQNKSIYDENLSVGNEEKIDDAKNIE